tara:strand:+ start:1582 stop:1857 length:276 start_codon:yes stop_codon:yes gene_type:complete
MNKDKVTNIDAKEEAAKGSNLDPNKAYTSTWKDTVSAITSIGKTLYEPAGMILALRKVEVSLLEVIKEINVEINKQQAIIDANKDKEADNG